MCRAYWKYTKYITASLETLLTIMRIAEGIEINSQSASDIKGDRWASGKVSK